jgi:hypothetical protein
VVITEQRICEYDEKLLVRNISSLKLGSGMKSMNTDEKPFVEMPLQQKRAVGVIHCGIVRILETIRKPLASLVIAVLVHRRFSKCF